MLKGYADACWGVMCSGDVMLDKCWLQLMLTVLDAWVTEQFNAA